MTHFYRQLLEESEQKHEATVAATDKRVIGPQGPSINLTIFKPPQLSSIPDAELARLAREKGKEVELNDDNQIVDKRELLSAGLNLSLPNTRFSGIRNPANNPQTDNSQSQTHRAVGTAASRKEINERRAREIQQQLEAEQQRTAQESQDAANEAMQRIIAKRNNDDDIEDARSRYLQRKRKRMEEERSKDPS
jgi:coiled-coil domain-containing protein 55